MSHYIMPSPVENAGGMYEFTKTVTVDAPKTVTVSVYAATRYILMLNHRQICEGPCRSTDDRRYFDRVTVTLEPGDNLFRLTVMHLGPAMFGQFPHFSTVFRTVAPEVVFEAVGEGVSVESDESWQCRFLAGHRLMYSHPEIAFPAPNEDIDTSVPDAVCSVSVAPDPVSFDSNGKTDYGFRLFPLLMPRPIPLILPGEPILPKVLRRGKNFVELDAGEYMTARVYAELRGQGNVKIIYAECFEFPEGKQRRDDMRGRLSGAYDRIYVNGRYSFQSFWFRAFRFLRIECDDPEGMLTALSVRRCHYPLEQEGSFFCSDENYNRMYQVSVNTLLCCTHEIFVDCPYYEQQQYVMDSAIESNVFMCLTRDTCMVRKCIRELAASQQPNGLLAANFPATYYQIIPGFSFFWIFLLKDYYEQTGDEAFVREQLPTAEKILSYFDRQIREKGLIGHSVYWDYADWVPGWTRGIPPTPEEDCITLYNLYYACALRAAGDLYKKTGRPLLAAEYAERYDRLRRTLNERCFDAREGLYRDGETVNSFSAHNIIWGILSGFLEGETAKKAAGRMFDPSFSQSSFSMNYYLFRALEACGRYDLVFSHGLSQWQGMLDNHCTTWCEAPDRSPRSECHAWSCAPLYEFAVHILGVQGRHEDEVVIEPDRGPLTFASGKVPTRHGLIEVEWNLRDGIFTLTVTTDAPCLKTAVLPDGSRHSWQNEKTVQLSCRL